MAAKLLRLPASRICNKKCSVESQKGLFDLLLFEFVVKFLIVRYVCLGYGLTDSINLAHLTATADTNADINVASPRRADDVSWFKKLWTEWCWLDQVQWSAVHADLATASEGGRACYRSLLFAKSLDLFLHFDFVKNLSNEK